MAKTFKPEIIDRHDLVEKGRKNTSSVEAWADHFIIGAMSAKFKGSDFHEKFDLENRPPDRLELVFTVNDVQVKFMPLIERLMKHVDRCVEEKLEQTLNEKFGAVDDLLDEVQRGVREMCQKKLGLEIKTEDED